MLSDREVDRYQRQLLLREIGGAGLAKLRRATVVIAGLGGIGCPAALYLAGAGVGRLVLVDDDAVARSNLQRQVLFTDADVGRLKVAAGTERLLAFNPDIAAEALAARITPANAGAIVAGASLVIDGTDSFAARLAISDACVAAGVPLVSAAIGGWEVQIALFSGRPCYRCFVPAPVPDADTCVAGGVAGPVPGIAGTLAALAALRALTGAGPDVTGQLLRFDGLGWAPRLGRIAADPGCAACGDGSTGRI